ncbi:TolC family outer membrane protein [Massilia sp. BJB1822]|uniref:TolC family outer membrane protein n=1 Tax=Massilia sp. BJB1822 TaxID=2744470 RepID=UPI001594B016|nr:TolC family outer membrane protein [Massilia sp. BJB1822]NVE01392.1 TolC family outer membrane protein [Massilia sp. BJB1822]
MARHSKNRLLPLALGAALLLQVGSASALGLLQAYEAALQNDPAFRAARAARDAGQENSIMGRSNLLPSVSGSFSGSQNRNTLTIGKHEEPRDYLSRSSTLQVRQPLFNMDGFARYKQGIAQTNYSDMQYLSQSQEVMLRVTGAYLDVLLKKDQLALAEAQRNMYAEQRKVNDRLFEKGEAAKTDMLETQARLDVAEAQVLEAQDDVNTALTNLAGIIGGEPGELDGLSPDFRVRTGSGQSFEEWKRLSLENNPDIKTLTYGVEIARQEVSKQRSGHAPRVDLVGTYGKSVSDSITTYNQETMVRSIGIQVNIPIYNGGAVSAASRQAVANQEKAKADLQTQTDKVTVELRKNYNLMSSSVARIEALMKSVDSGKLLVKATEQSIKGGVRINLDLLNAQQQLFTSKRDLAQARYNYLMATLRLRAAAGVLASDDLREVAANFR